MNNQIVTISTVVKASIEKVWSCWTEPSHITQWNSASDDWHTPHAENDLRNGGKFTSTMSTRDGSESFELQGTYDVVTPESYIEYTLSDGRKVKVSFLEEKNGIHIEETFDAENSNPAEMQKVGWQAILDNFKKYVEELED